MSAMSILRSQRPCTVRTRLHLEGTTRGENASRHPHRLSVAENDKQSCGVHAQVWDLFVDGTIKPYTGDVYPLEKALEAVEASVKQARGGKILLEG